MPTLFDITAPSSSITLDASRKASAPFTVSNISGRSLRGRVQVSADTPSTAAWLTLVEDTERQYGTGSSQQYSVMIAVPPTAAAGNYNFTLTALDVSNPDDSLVKGPNVTITVPAAEPVKKPFPWWIVILVVVFIVAIIGIILAINSSNQATIAAQTSTAAFNATATLNANGTAVQEANLTATAGANLAATNAANARATTAAQQTSSAATQNASGSATAIALTSAAQTQAAQNAARTATAASLNATATRNAFNLNATATQKVISVTQTFVARPTVTPTPIPNARITVTNDGGFVIAFAVVYTLANGSQIGQNSVAFPVGQSRSVDIPGDSKNVFVVITVSGVDRTCQKTYATAKTTSIRVTGTIFGMDCN